MHLIIVVYNLSITQERGTCLYFCSNIVEICGVKQLLGDFLGWIKKDDSVDLHDVLLAL